MNDLFMCNYADCQKSFLEPVLLPCAKNVCKSHIDSLIASKQLSFECQFCSKTHTIPSDGFTPNDLLIAIMDRELSADVKREEARELIDKMDKICGELDVVQTDPVGFIGTYVDSFRTSIDSERIHLKSEIDQLSEKMLDTLRTYESECKQNVSNVMMMMMANAKKKAKTTTDKNNNNTEFFLARAENISLSLMSLNEQNLDSTTSSLGVDDEKEIENEKEEEEKKEKWFDLAELKRKMIEWRDRLRQIDLDEKSKDDLLVELKEYFTQSKEEIVHLKDQLLMSKGAEFVKVARGDHKDKEQKQKEFHHGGNELFGRFELNEFHSVKGRLTLVDFESTILQRRQMNDLVSNVCRFPDPFKTKFTLKYRASRDGFHSSRFHALCDSIGPSLVIVQAKHTGYVFGGFTTQSWTHSGNRKLDPAAFIFSYTNKEEEAVKMSVDESQQQYAIGCYSNYGPCFGGGYDFCIYSDSNVNSSSNSNLGHSYKHPVLGQGTPQAKSFLAGSYQFSTQEIEVYQVLPRDAYAPFELELN